MSTTNSSIAGLRIFIISLSLCTNETEIIHFKLKDSEKYAEIAEFPPEERFKLAPLPM